MDDLRLFIPGPTQVPDRTLQAMTRQMIGHRSRDFSELYQRLSPMLRKLLRTDPARCLLFTSSATGVMEAGIRNLVPVGGKVLNLCVGAFSDRWHDISLACGRDATALRAEWGSSIAPAQVKEALAGGDYAAVTLVHNETSTGVMADLPGIARAVRDAAGDEICLLVDAVTSMSAVHIPVDELDLDLCLAGTQKAFAMPPGLTVAAVSPRALERAAGVEQRGFYFDFLLATASAEKDQTPFTPAISLMYALEASLEQMFEEGLDVRYARHRELASVARAWAKERFELFPAECDASLTLTVVKNTHGIDVTAMIEFMRSKGILMANGYGKLKGETFRIGHMGEVRVEELQQVLGWMDEYLETVLTRVGTDPA